MQNVCVMQMVYIYINFMASVSIYSEVNAFQLSLPKADCMLQLYKN